MAARLGWFVNVVSKTALSVDPGAAVSQLVPVPQVALVVPLQCRSVPNVSFGARANKHEIRAALRKNELIDRASDGAER